MTRILQLTVAALAFSACADPALVQRITDLEGRVTALEARPAGAAAPGAPAAPSADDEAAIALYKEAMELSQSGKTDEAKAKFQEIMARYSSTRVAQAAQSQYKQLSVVGSDISTLGSIDWYRGQSDVNQGKVTLLVFWEVWCPHCRREVPKLEATFEKYKGQGLNVIGLTKLSRGKTKEEVLEFADEQHLSYPIGKEDGTMSDFFGVQGVPAAAVVIDGKVVWRDHPARLTDDMIEGWLKQG